MRTIMIPLEDEGSIWREIESADNGAADRILHLMRHAVVLDGGVAIASADDAAWAFRYGTAAPIVGKRFASFAPEGPDETHNEVFKEVCVGP